MHVTQLATAIASYICQEDLSALTESGYIVCRYPSLLSRHDHEMALCISACMCVLRIYQYDFFDSISIPIILCYHQYLDSSQPIL